MFLGLAPGDWFMIPIVLVLAAGPLHVGAAREGDAPDGPLENGSPVAPAARYALLGVVLLRAPRAATSGPS